MNAASPLFQIHGKAFQRRARIEVFPDHLVCHVARGQFHPTPEEIRLSVEELTMFFLRALGWSRESTFGLFLAFLGILWQFYESTSLLVSAVLVGVGTVAVILRRLLPVHLLVVKTRQTALMVKLRRRSLESCRKAVRFLQEKRPDLAGGRLIGAAAFLALQLRTGFMDEASIREEFRRAFPGIATPEEERRFTGLRRKLARWNILWMVVFPAVLAVGAQFFLPALPAGWMMLRTGIWLAVWFALFMVVQSWFLPRMLRKWGL
jgi:hypothetical protein